MHPSQKCGCQAYVVLVCESCSLVPRLISSYTVQKMGREPGSFDPVGDDVLCVVWIIKLLPTHAILRVNCAGDRIVLLTVHLVHNKTQNKEMGHIIAQI